VNVENPQNAPTPRLSVGSDKPTRSGDDDRKASTPDLELEQHAYSYLFTLRVWQEVLGEGKAEWRGRVLEIASGEALFFRDWPGLVATLQRLIAKTAASRENSPGQPSFTHENDE
jgi:hypothetical protein